jgi:predicted negative regulator of RcsB-dependent stress response
MSKQPIEQQQVTPLEPGEKVVAWIKRYQRPLIAVAAVLVIVAAGVWFVLEYRSRKEEAAQTALEQARFATQSGNLPLAATDLSRLVATYGGTEAADEGVILLAQVRLLQDEASMAADELRKALDGGMASQFRAGAYSLLGAALENLGNMSEAAQAYENAAGAAWYGFLSAQYLNDAGRAYAQAGDTSSAIAAYRKVVNEYSDSPSVTEAEVRIGELESAHGGPGAAGDE